jgi:hypothetical protein
MGCFESLAHVRACLGRGWRQEKSPPLSAGGLKSSGAVQCTGVFCARSYEGGLDHRGHLHAIAVRCSPMSDARRWRMAKQKTSKIALRREPELRDSP